MTLIHVPFGYYPDPVGGTEVYVDGLARNQQQRDIDVVVAAPGGRNEGYFHNGIAVRRFAVSERLHSLRDLYGEGDQCAAHEFGRILDEKRPDLVHLHAFTRGVSLQIVHEAKHRDIPVVFTYHTATVSCQRGTLLQWGSQVCDGVLDVHTCARCALHGHGMSTRASLVVGSLSPAAGRLFGAVGLSGGAWTALRMTELVELRHETFRKLMREVDHIVTLCQWAKELLLRNAVPAGKITVSRQGLCQESTDTGQPPNHSFSLRIVFLGRMDPTKGAHVLIQALRLIPQLPLSLDLYGVAQGEVGRSYREDLRQMAMGDPRIEFHPAIPSGNVISQLREYEVLALPSQCLEVAPLVVLEAFAAGIPVLGSNLGGIAELVEDGTNGLLVEHQSVTAWAQALKALCNDRGLLLKLRSGVRTPRRMSVVASEMLELYRTVLQKRTHMETAGVAN